MKETTDFNENYFRTQQTINAQRKIWSSSHFRRLKNATQRHSQPQQYPCDNNNCHSAIQNIFNKLKDKLKTGVHEQSSHLK